MPLGKHQKTEQGRFRQERSDSKAKNLAKDYPEFAKIKPEKTLGEIKKQLGVDSLDQARKELRKKK